jgi:malate dehydrogenase (oxaloacetate-decarboxylating)(NADP+)
VPEVVKEAYGGEEFAFGPRYIIPKPFDTRVLSWVSSAVAQAAIETGVAQEPLDIAAYRARLERKVML